MPRGGKREGSGAKPKWEHGRTTVIRVPEVLADDILDYARKLDKNLVTKSKTIDLSGVNVPSLRRKQFVFLQDLVRLGYEIYPLDIATKVRAELNLSKRS